MAIRAIERIKEKKEKAKKLETYNFRNELARLRTAAQDIKSLSIEFACRKEISKYDHEMYGDIIFEIVKREMSYQLADHIFNKIQLTEEATRSGGKVISENVFVMGANPFRKLV